VTAGVKLSWMTDLTCYFWVQHLLGGVWHLISEILHLNHRSK